MFGVVPKAIWSKMVQPDEQNRIPLQTNCLLLDDGSQKVLIETGFGDKWSDKERGFFALEHRTVVDALREVHIEPAQINHIVLTHLHFDHAAGLTRLNAAGEAVSIFPNAVIHVQRTEWNDALANTSTMTRTYLCNHLDPIAGQVRLVEAGHGRDSCHRRDACATEQTKATEIMSGMFVWPMPGHTWGQQAVRFDDGQGTVCFAGDVLPTVHHSGLAFSLGYDMLPYENMLQKQRLLARVAQENWRLVLDHEPGAAVVRVHPDTHRPGQYQLLAASGET